MGKVLILTSGHNRFGGTSVKLKKMIEKSCHDYIIYFVLFAKEKSIYAENKKWFSASPKKIAVYEGFYNRNLFFHIRKIHQIVKNENIRLIHVYFDLETVIAMFYKLFVNPKIMLIRSFEGYEKRNLSYIRKYILAKSYALVDKFIFVSHYIKRQFETDFPVIKTKDGMVIYNSPINISKNLTPYLQRKKMVCISGLTSRKNLEVLIECMDLIVNVYKKPYILEILGDGDKREQYEQMISDRSLGNHVILVGYTSDVDKYLNDCILYLHPADTEGFGIAVAEAMKMKCPVIAANAGALPELIDDGIEGYLVAPYAPRDWADKICTLMENPLLRNKMSDAAKERVEKSFTEELFVENHDQLYSKSFINSENQ